MSFDPFAAEYDAHLTRGISLSGEDKEFFARGRLVAAALYLQAVGVRPRRIVEFGCGIGTNLGTIAAMWPESSIVGIDRSESSLEVARARGVDARIGLMTPADYVAHSTERADWVFCNGVFHHIPPAEQPGALEQIRSTLRPGGAFTLFDNNPFNPGARWVMKRIPFDHDAIMINPYTLARRLREAGFDEVRCRFLFVFPRFVSMLRPLEPHLERLPLGAQYGVCGILPRDATA
ncbi:MAG TPA: class I SAM-dependent methyltransferase [Candidatus Polarisedimenticolia bacterium]|nr:class I SAM-dependent methyltransferase [Candidatus Polarisedimenticolia bacterium]